MTDGVIVLIYAALCVLCAYLLIRMATAHRHKRMAKEFMRLALCLIVWLLIMIGFHSTNSERVAILLCDLKLPFVALVSLLLFFFVLRFYAVQAAGVMGLRAVFFIIPVVTLLLALFTTRHPHLRVDIYMASMAPVNIARGTRGMWFWVHAAYCYALVLVSCVVTAVQHKKLPPMYRTASQPMIIGLLLSIVGNLFVVSDLSGVYVDFSLMGGCVCLLLLYFAIKSSRGLDYLAYARKQTYQKLSKSILILDGDTVLSANETACEFFKKLGFEDIQGISFLDIQRHLQAAAKHMETLQEGDSGVDYTLADGEKVYNMRRKWIVDKKDVPIGAFVTIEDVTANRELIRRLEAVSGMDALTGLYNRRRMDEFQQEIDNTDSLPLAVISADLNNLKLTNDTLGHEKGDVMLRAAADVLASISPPNAYVGRVGGDEFLVFMPRCNWRQANVIIAGMRNLCTINSTTQTPVSLAFGVAVKEKEIEELSQIIALADDRMYADKAAYKIKTGITRPPGRVNQAFTGT